MEETCLTIFYRIRRMDVNEHRESHSGGFRVSLDPGEISRATLLLRLAHEQLYRKESSSVSGRIKVLNSSLAAASQSDCRFAAFVISSS